MGRKPLDKVRSQDINKQKRIVEKVLPFVLMHGIKFYTIDELAKIANISKATFYQQFPSKDVLIESLVDYVLLDILSIEKVLSNKAIDVIEKYFTAISIFFQSTQGLSTTFLADIKVSTPHVWQKIEQFILYCTQLIALVYEEGKAHGVFRDINTDFLMTTDKLFFMHLSDPDFLQQSGLNFQAAFNEYFRMKCYALLIYKSEDTNAKIESMIQQFLFNHNQNFKS